MIDVSIITPCYKSKNFIKHTLESVNSQSFKNYEHIIILDDDEEEEKRKTLEIIKNFSYDIKVLKTSGKTGASNARNIGIKASKGSYIAFLDSDDIWHKDKLKKQINFMKNKDLSISHTDYNEINEQGDFIKKRFSPKRITYNDLLISPRLGCLTLMAKRTLFKSPEPFPNYKCRNDYAAWLKIFKSNASENVSEILASYTLRRDSISSNTIRNFIVHYQVLREVANQPVLQALMYTISNYLLKFTDILLGKR